MMDGANLVVKYTVCTPILAALQMSTVYELTDCLSALESSVLILSLYTERFSLIVGGYVLFPTCLA